MELKDIKVLDDERKIFSGPKAKQQATSSALNVAGADHALVQHHSIVDQSTVSCKPNLSCCSQRRMLNNYQDFLKSNLPKCILFYDGNAWQHFPCSMISTIRDDFQRKKSVTEVIFDSQHLLLDFVHMVCVDMEKEVSRPIAWIDEHGKCFFPELYSGFNTACGCFHSKRGAINVTSMTSGTQVLEAHKISRSSADSSNCEHLDEVISNAKQRYTRSASYQRHIESYETTGENDPYSFTPSGVTGFGSLQSKSTKPPIGLDVYVAVQKILLLGLGQYIGPKDIVGIFRTPLLDYLGQVRYKPFQNQVELTKIRRGNANVRYAWLASSKDAIEDVMLNGVMQMNTPSHGPLFGSGIHLAPANRSDICANYSDVDENGLVYMVLCRVILGNAEVLQTGSKLHQPSNGKFDSGIDNCQKPKHYVIWNVHTNTHIYPEYVVIFKMPSKAKECLVGKESASGVMDSTSSPSQEGMCLTGVTPTKTHGEKTQASRRIPGTPMSPYMPFSMLFASISTKVPRQYMETICTYYEEFKRGQITRMDLVKMLRQLVGDELLKTTVTRLQHKLPPVARLEALKPWLKKPNAKFCASRSIPDKPT